MELKELQGKKIFVKLIDGGVYTGVVESVFNDVVSITDKFGNSVMFSTSQILKLEEKK